MEILSNPFIWLFLFIVSLVVGAVWRLRTNEEPQPPQPPDHQPLDQPRVEQVNVGLLAVLATAAVLFFQLPSLSIDINQIFAYAFDVVNAFMPLIAIVAGLGLGFNLINKITQVFNRSF